MSLVVVGMADCQWSQSSEDVLVTYALGSCIGVSVFDPVSRVGGLLHYMLPDSSIDPAGGRITPHKYADTGIASLLRGAAERGAQPRRLIVRVAGAAHVMDETGVFNIGKRNYQAMRKLLWKFGLLLHGEAVGGNVSRTVRLDLGTGKFWLREGGGSEKELAALAHGGREGEGWRTAS